MAIFNAGLAQIDDEAIVVGSFATAFELRAHNHDTAANESAEVRVASGGERSIDIFGVGDARLLM